MQIGLTFAALIRLILMLRARSHKHDLYGGFNPCVKRRGPTGRLTFFLHALLLRQMNDRS